MPATRRSVAPFIDIRRKKKGIEEQWINLTIVGKENQHGWRENQPKEPTMKTKYIEQVDQKTGEVLQGCMVWIPERPKLTERWFMAFQDAFEELAKDREITNEPRRVLDYMFSKLDFENFIQLSQKEIIEILGINKSNVSKAIKLLTRKQIVLEGQK